jgi:low temperature requirement protein LtrA
MPQSAGPLAPLRTPSEHGQHRVTYVELLFDLVFVFAITQISHLLIKDFSVATTAQAAFLLLAVWWVWIFTAWVTNWVDPDTMPVRALLLVLTTVGLILAATIPQAAQARGLAFAGAYVCMQVGRTGFVVWAVRGERSPMARSFRRILAWFAVTAVLWIAGGVAEGTTRWSMWGLALSLEFLAPWVGFWTPGLGRAAPKDWVVERGHMAERCALFVMIALGESILVTGAAFAPLAWTPSMIAAFLTSLLGALAMWWLYFAATVDSGNHRISRSEHAARLGRLAYTYLHILLVVGIVLSAVGDGLTLADPTGPSGWNVVVAVLGGTAIYLAGLALLKRAFGAQVGWTPAAAIALLGMVTFAKDNLSPLALMTSSTLVLAVLVLVEERGLARARATAAIP